jgi:hypothetical protein
LKELKNKKKICNRCKMCNPYIDEMFLIGQTIFEKIL